MNLFSLEGKISFVTGAGSGIGQRIAVGLAEVGASVGCFDLASSTGLNSTVEQIQKLGCRAIAVIGDVTQAADLNQAVDTVEKELGPLSVALNCAGIANAAPAEEMPLEQWQRVMGVNLTGVFLSLSGRGKGYVAEEAGFNRQYRIDVGHHSEPRAYASPLQRFKSRGHPLVQKLGNGMD